MFRRDFDNGKYTVTHNNGVNFQALRYGEPWRSLNGDGLVLAMAQEVEALDTQVASLQECLATAQGYRTFVENFARKIGWDDKDAEGAFEYIQRTSYAQGHADGRVETLNGGRRP